jgi:hypothetical protein
MFTGYGERRLITQITYIPRVPQCLPSPPNWNPTPSPTNECVYPQPGTKRGMGHSPVGEGVRGALIWTTGEKPSTLSALWVCRYPVWVVVLNRGAVLL